MFNQNFHFEAFVQVVVANISLEKAIFTAKPKFSIFQPP